MSLALSLSLSPSLSFSLSLAVGGWVGYHAGQEVGTYMNVCVCVCLCVSRMCVLAHTQASLLKMTEVCVEIVLYNVVLHENMYVYMHNVFSSSYNLVFYGNSIIFAQDWAHGPYYHVLVLTCDVSRSSTRYRTCSHVRVSAESVYWERYPTTDQQSLSKSCFDQVSYFHLVTATSASNWNAPGTVGTERP